MSIFPILFHDDGISLLRGIRRSRAAKIVAVEDAVRGH